MRELNKHLNRHLNRHPGTEGLACFDNLGTPEYPKNALQAHVDGSVWTWTQVNPQGAVDKIDATSLEAA